MFGYVKTYTPELKVVDYEYYRGAYCGLCRAMGKCTGQCSRMTLSYDFAFLALLRLSLSGEKVSFSKRRCVAHPLRKRNMMDRNRELDYCAYAAALLSYHKLADDISDEKGAKRAAAILARPFAGKMRRKALRKGDKAELDSFVAGKLASLAEFEKSGEASVDAPADIFGELLAGIVEFGFEGSERRIAHNIGYHVGRWIYITDALDDLSEDIEKKRYNPFALMYGGELDERERSLIADALKNALCDAEAALDLIDFGDNKSLGNIVYNVFYLGMPRTAENVLGGRSERDKKDKKDKNCHRKDNLNTDE
ncbi:MAG: hypothetical protein J6A83_05170 [Clostridia bacterium]|nr:hypothetical protein [Clostridia bacterium]